MSESGYRRLFIIAAWWNLAGGAFIAFATPWIFESAGLPAPSPPLYYQAWIALFLTFGYGYLLVARDLFRNRDIALLGAIGKSGFAAVFLFHMARDPGVAPWFFLIPVIGDLVFVALFIMFLLFLRRKGTVR
jgi:hypothetical protein